MHPRTRDDSACDEHLGHLHAVERRALAQVVAGDPEVERTRLGRVFPDPADEHRIDPAASSGVGKPSPSSTSRTPGASRSSSTASAFVHRAVEADVHATPRGRRTPGTRTQVTAHLMSSSWRILRVSRTIFHSSDV